MEGTSKKLVIFFAVILFIVIAIGLFWIFTYKGTVDANNNNDLGLFWWIFSFAAGLTMIVLPCTLPLAFVIVPLSMGRGLVKGLGMALSFGLGIALTLSIYGVVAAVAGKAAITALGSDGAETIKNWVYFIAGIFALVFALSEIGLMKFRMPTYTGAAPAFIQKRQDYLKALLLGLFLGNVGIGCPHPATPLLLIHIAVNGNIMYGWLLFLVHAIGRILPLLLLAVLGIMGVNGLSWLITRKDRVERVTGWAMVFVAGFILTLGLFSHKWWVNSGIHTQLESITQEESFLNIIKTNIGSSVTHSHTPEIGTGLFGLPLWLGNWFLVFLWVFPIWWWWMKEKKRVSGIPPPNQVSEKDAEYKLLMSREKFFTTLTIVLALVFIYILPTKFFNEAAQHMHTTTPSNAVVPMHTDGDTHESATTTTTGVMGAMDDHMMMGATELFEEGAVKKGLSVDFIKPKNPHTGVDTPLQFFVNEKPAGTPVDDLQVEHEKYMHVIGVRDDLTQFFHLHPEKTKAGTWTIPHTFKEGGTYKIWTDVTRGGTSYSFGHPLLSVTDNGKVPTVPKQPVDFLTNVMVGDYQVGVHYDTPLVKGAPEAIQISVKNLYGNGVELDPYLGAQMHLVIIKDDLTEYLHVHPAGHMHMGNATQEPALSRIINIASAHGGEEEAVDPSMLEFDPTFEKEGTYKLFAQFRPKDAHLGVDEALVAEFYVKVAKEGQKVTETTATKVDPQVKWWSLFFISIILMSVLSYGVYRYLEVK